MYTNIICTETKLNHIVFLIPLSLIRVKSSKIVYISTCKYIFTMYALTPDNVSISFRAYPYLFMDIFHVCSLCSELANLYPWSNIHGIITNSNSNSYILVYDLICMIYMFLTFTLYPLIQVQYEKSLYKLCPRINFVTV